MSVFSDHFERSGAPKLVGHYADLIQYSDDADVTDAITIRAKLTKEKQERRKDELGGWSVVTTRTARYISASVTETIRLDGTITINSVDYSIEHIGTAAGVMTVLSLIRVEAGEVTRSNYRGR